MSESTYYYHKKQVRKSRAKHQNIKERIRTIFEESNETYGYRRITRVLKNEGVIINHKRVLRYMRDLNIKCIKFSNKTRKYKSYKGKVGIIAPHRVRRRFSSKYPLQKLTTDVSEFKCIDGTKRYLSPILDMYNSEIISYKISKHPTLDIATDPLKKAIKKIQNHGIYRTTIHSDQGWQYQNKGWVHLLKENKIYQSMSRKGNCIDNSIMENFFGILKQEIYYGNTRYCYEELKYKIERYIKYYNYSRIKEKLGGLSPVQYRKFHSQFIN